MTLQRMSMKPGEAEVGMHVMTLVALPSYGLPVGTVGVITSIIGQNPGAQDDAVTVHPIRWVDDPREKSFAITTKDLECLNQRPDETCAEWQARVGADLVDRILRQERSEGKVHVGLSPSKFHLSVAPEDMNPADCTCNQRHCSEPSCRSSAPSKGAVPESGRLFPAAEAAHPSVTAPLEPAIPERTTVLLNVKSAEITRLSMDLQDAAALIRRLRRASD
jgi:hypothetical protein